MYDRRYYEWIKNFCWWDWSCASFHRNSIRGRKSGKEISNTRFYLLERLFEKNGYWYLSFTLNKALTDWESSSKDNNGSWLNWSWKNNPYKCFSQLPYGNKIYRLISILPCCWRWKALAPLADIRSYCILSPSLRY